MSSTRAVQPPRIWPFRYEMIEGLRGPAFLVVVMHHLRIVTIGHYAVRLFFVISGYCIAAATEAGRRKGLSWSAFMQRRLHWIYPPYLLAIIFYVATRLVKAASGAGNDLVHPWIVWVQNLTMTQWFSLLSHPVADAPQNPALLISAFWSLNYEDQFYLVMAAVMVMTMRSKLPALVPVAALAAVGLVWNVMVPGGWICGIFLEYWIHFALGVLLFHALCLSTDRRFRYGFLAAVAALGVYSALRVFPWRPEITLELRVYPELLVVCAFTFVNHSPKPDPVAQPASALGAAR